MLKFDKKFKNNDQPAKVSSQPAMDLNITIHTMPKKFIARTGDLKKSRNTGLLVLSLGFIVLISIFIFGYFYFIKSSGSQSQTKNTELAPVAENKNQPTNFSDSENIDNATAVDNLATSTSSTTVDNLSAGATTSEIVTDTTGTSSPAAVAQTATASPATEIKSNQDSDQDGLTDAEEMILGTKIDNVDTDGDGYKDLAELLNLFNPAGSGKIIVNPNVEKYINSKNNYSLYYPKAWVVNTSFGADSILFQAAENEFIQVIVQTNILNSTLRDWYQEQFGVAPADNQIVNKLNWTGIKSVDGLNYYLLKPGSDKIFTIAYNIGVNNTASYKNILNMMVNSLETGF